MRRVCEPVVPEFVTLGAGLWLAVSPWILGYSTNHSAWLSELVPDSCSVLPPPAPLDSAAPPPGARTDARRRRSAIATQPAQVAGSGSQASHAL